MREYEPTTEDMREHHVELVEQSGGQGWWAGKRFDDWLDREFFSPEKELDEAMDTISKLEKEFDEAMDTISKLEDEMYDLRGEVATVESEVRALQKENDRLKGVLSKLEDAPDLYENGG